MYDSYYGDIIKNNFIFWSIVIFYFLFLSVYDFTAMWLLEQCIGLSVHVFVVCSNCFSVHL